MAASTMITASAQSAMLGRSTTKPFTGQPIRPTRAGALSRSRRHVVKAVAKDDSKGSSKIALGLAGVFAATQLALISAAPAEAFDLFPKTAVSQSARDKLNKKTDNLPTVTEAGKELTGGSDPIGAKNPKDLGKAVDKATPDVDLTQNPKSLGKQAKNALPDVSAVPSRDDIIKATKKKRTSSNSNPAKRAPKPPKAPKAPKISTPKPPKAPKAPKPPSPPKTNPLTSSPQQKVKKSAGDAASKAKSTANKAGSKVPSPKDIQKKLESTAPPLGALPDPKELANKAKTSTPNAGNLASKAKANVPQPAADLKSKIKNTPSATIGLAFELADLQGQNNQSQNYPSPGKNYKPGKPSDTIGPIPDKIPGPLDDSMSPDPSKVSSKTPGAGAGISSAQEISGPDVGKAARQASNAADSLPNPAEKAGNPLDSVKSLFGQ